MLVEKNQINAKKIYDHTCKGKCSQCGDCCGLFIPYTEKELSIIKEYVKNNNIQPVNRETIIGFRAQCPFFDNVNHKCNIYEVRPYACRDFMCSHKDWEKRRDHYETRAKYNSHLSKKIILGTFDDKVFEDYTPILRYLLDMVKCEKGIDTARLINLLRSVNRLDLLNYFTAYDEKGNAIQGIDLLNQ